MFFFQTPCLHPYPHSSFMFSISGKNTNIRPACSALNISYLDCYRSPSSKVLNISTLPCIHHVLYFLRVLYVSIQHGNMQVMPFLTKTCKRHWAQDQNITFLSMLILAYPNFNPHYINSHTITFQASESTC